MKKSFWIILLAVLVAVTLACCGTNEAAESTPTPQDTPTSAVEAANTPTDAPTPTVAPTDMPTNEPTPTNTATPTQTPLPIAEKGENISDQIQLFYGSTAVNAQLRLIGPRAYVQIDGFALALGGDVAQYGNEYTIELFGKSEKLDITKGATHKVYSFDGENYMSLFDAAQMFDLAVVFNENETVSVYNKEIPKWEAMSSMGKKKSYLRLEDINADYGVGERYTHLGLEKLRVLCNYLECTTDAFYIAWIPLYMNPPLGIENDISRNFNFYNADFVYTLDYMVKCGGLMGLHGLTHQWKNEVSAIGDEFGKDCGLTTEQIIQRFNEAKRICTELGYEYTFFEFPHYTATNEQMDLAGEHFDIIYQQYYKFDKPGQIETKKINGKTVYYVPTPADYVYSEYDLQGVLGRLDALKDYQERSLFFHPSLDYSKVGIATDGTVRRYTYDLTRGILSNICNKLYGDGYCFGAVK